MLAQALRSEDTCSVLEEGVLGTEASLITLPFQLPTLWGLVRTGPGTEAPAGVVA